MAREKLTSVEAAIYAATWAKAYDEGRRDPSYYEEGREEFELDAAAAAAETATYAVERFRACGRRVREGYAGTSVNAMYLAARRVK